MWISCNDDSCCPNKDKFASETHVEDRTDVTNACVFKYLVYANLYTQTQSWDACQWMFLTDFKYPSLSTARNNCRGGITKAINLLYLQLSRM